MAKGAPFRSYRLRRTASQHSRLDRRRRNHYSRRAVRYHRLVHGRDERFDGGELE